MQQGWKGVEEEMILAIVDGDGDDQWMSNGDD